MLRWWPFPLSICIYCARFYGIVFGWVLNFKHYVSLSIQLVQYTYEMGIIPPSFVEIDMLPTMNNGEEMIVP